MAVYKVIQDIEAEDKLLGPLTLKSFIYAAIAGVLIFIDFRLLVAGGPIYVRLVVAFILLMPALLLGVLASPLGRDQPTEVWLLSHIRFILKPRNRSWDQTGLDKLVTITAPKRAELHLTKEFSQNEVQSRLQALATTLDSRGWAVKNSAVNLSNQPSYTGSDDNTSDRLITPTAEPAQVIDVHPSDDILDEQNNVTAQHLSEMVTAADNQRKQAVADKLNAAREQAQKASKKAAAATPAPKDTRFLDGSTTSGDTVFIGRNVVTPQAESSSKSDSTIPSAEDEAILAQIHKRDEEIHRLSASFHSKAKNAAPKDTQTAAPAPRTQPVKAPQNTVTAAPAAAKLELAQSGNDLSVASIAHLANRTREEVRQIGPGEVEISLH